jgi:hypothetical protein
MTYPAEDWKPGDVGFAHTNGAMGKVIRVGEWLRLHKNTWNHQFALDRYENGEWYVIQAEMAGVTNTRKLEEVAPGGRYEIVPLPTECNRDLFLEFIRGEVGAEYGWTTDLAMSIDILSWSWFPSFRGARKASWQCAALINEGMRFGGWYHRYLDVYCVFPEQGYDALCPGG